jgi:hypothetical protein
MSGSSRSVEARGRQASTYSVEKLDRAMMHPSAIDIDLSDRRRIDDRQAVKGSRTPANGSIQVAGEFFNRIDPLLPVVTRRCGRTPP